MPKRAKVDAEGAADLFAPTTPQPAQPGEKQEKIKDPVQPRGVGLRESEWRKVDRLAQELGMKPGSLAAFALRYFIAAYDRGLVELENRPRPKLPGE